MEPEIEIEIEDINETNLKNIPEPCKGCIYWEFPVDFEKAKGVGDPNKKRELEDKKKEWFAKTIKQFGACGKIVYYERKPIAYAQYAPSLSLPNINEYESKQSVGLLEEGVVFLSCLYVIDKSMRGLGIGERLLQSIIDDLKKRGFKAIETFARRSDAENPSGPMMFYIRNGFHVKDKTNPEFPLMRIFL